MYQPLFGRVRARLTSAVALAVLITVAGPVARHASAQNLGGTNSGTANGSILYKVQSASERMEMIVNTSRIIALDHKIPKYVVSDPDKVKVTPLSAYQLQVAATKTGVSQINLWDEKDQIHTIDLVIFGDARELQLVLENEFKHSALTVRPLASSVVVSGYVDRPDHVNRIIRIAEDYYPKVINNITVGGVQQVQLRCKVMEVSRTKLRNFGFDWAAASGNDFIVSSVSGLINAASISTGTATGLGGDTIRFGIVDGSTSFFGFLEALRQYDLAKILSEPTLTTVSGRPAYFEVGGEFPIPIPQSLGTITVEYKKFGTRLDFVPIVLGNGNIRLEVRPSVSEVDDSRGVTLNSFVIPGIRTRSVDTGVEMKAGQTLALAGLLQFRTESQNRGVPWLADLPWFGAPFRRVHEEVNEIELLILVTPELVDAMDPEEVPPCGPGMHSVSPNDVDLYWRGYLEIPRCDGACPNIVGGQGYTGDQGQGQALPGTPHQGHAPAQGGAPSPPKPAQPKANSGASTPNVQSNSGGKYYVKTSEPVTMGSDPMAGVNSLPAASNRRVHQTPASATASDIRPLPSQAPNQYSPQNRTSTTPAAPAPPSSPGGTPGLIGPVGYDVVE